MTLDQLEREMLGQPVASLQYMLRQLSKRYSFLPELAVDGIFGEDTLEAVMLFQRELHQPVTGIVDQGTWNAIRDEWLRFEQEEALPRPVRVFPEDGRRVNPGGKEDQLILPQTMFQVLSNYLVGIRPDQPDGYHGEASVENIKWLQSRAQIDQTGVMDRLTWDMLSRLYELFVTAQKETQSGELRSFG